MSETAVPARVKETAPVASTVAEGEPRKLDDVLLAMDVVDTLRHRTRIVDMELNAEAREEQLIARLKEIYGAQGIEVPDKILKDGVKALEEQRFLYKPPENSFSVKLAKLYVSRGQWLPAAMTFTGAIAALVIGWQVFWAIPQANEWRGMPAEIAKLSADSQALAIDPAVDGQVQGIERAGMRAVSDRNHGAARAQVAALKDLNTRLASEYDVRIVSRPDEDTGFYRTPPNNPVGRNYYLVVEAVPPGGGLIDVPVVNEETKKVERVSKWAQRVTEGTFDKVKEEKQGTGIISNDVLGHKARGELEPKYDVPTPGGAITKW
jgi:Family of unknown function (DUF6384)